MYDSNDEPAVLDFVPEAIWTLGDGTIESYKSAGTKYTVTFAQEFGNTENMPTYQFLAGDLGGMVKADSRFYIETSLDLDSDGNYSLFTDAYVIEAGKRAVIGDDTGLGLVLTTTAEGTYTENADGTITTSKASHAVYTMETDTYSAQMKGAAQMAVNGKDADGTYDSNDEPAVLDFVPETIWTLDGTNIVSWVNPEEEAEAEDTEAGEDAKADEDTKADEDAKAVGDAAKDAGTYTYEDGTLTLTNSKGDKVISKGDPLKFHYVTAVSDQLTGDFTISAAKFK